MSMQCTGGATLDAEGAEKSAEPLRTTEPRGKPLRQFTLKSLWLTVAR
jgi:hypothetical protein